MKYSLGFGSENFISEYSASMTIHLGEPMAGKLEEDVIWEGVRERPGLGMVFFKALRACDGSWIESVAFIPLLDRCPSDDVAA